MFIKNRISTNNIVFLASRTEPEEDLGVVEFDIRHRDKGCVMVGYHYVIKRDGMIETGRELDKRGHHRRRYNKDSVYVCVVGADANFTPQQLSSVQTLEAELVDMYPEAQIVDLT